MKLNIRNTGLALVAALAFTACNDVVDYSVPDKTASNGAPVINAIYDVQDTGYAAPLTNGELDQMLHIKGQNLSHVKKITFNSVDVDLKQVYAESENSYVKIPRVIPDAVTDTLVYETEQGTVRMYFPVTIPSVTLNGLQNEFALQGSAVQLNGSNFDLYNFGDTTETSPVSIEINNTAEGYHKAIHTDSCTETYTSIVIPKDCPDNSLITFKWKGLNGEMTKTVPYRMTDDLLIDWDADYGSGMGSFTTLTDGSNAGDPKSLGYKFLRINGVFDNWSWNGSYFGLTWPEKFADASANPQNYVFKMEVWTNSANPIPSYGDNGANGAKNGGYLITLNGAKTRCQFDFQNQFGFSNTYGEWVTVTMPLEDMFNSEGELTPPQVGKWCNIEFIMQPNGSAWNCDHAFGQFRIEPKNY